MSLKQCEECGEEVSTKAGECPNCGAPVKEPTGCEAAGVGCGVVLVLVVGLAGGVLWYLFSWTAPHERPGNAAPPAAQSTIEADLDNFKIVTERFDRLGITGTSRSVKFRLKISNTGTEDATVYVVIYAKNDRFTPPRRTAWPFPGILFRLAGGDRGSLSPYDISKNWETRPENSKGFKGGAVAGRTRSKDCAVPLNERSMQGAWKNMRLDPRSVYDQWYVWLFAEDGSLIFEKEMRLQIGE